MERGSVRRERRRRGRRWRGKKSSANEERTKRRRPSDAAAAPYEAGRGGQQRERENARQRPLNRERRLQLLLLAGSTGGYCALGGGGGVFLACGLEVGRYCEGPTIRAWLCCSALLLEVPVAGRLALLFPHARQTRPASERQGQQPAPVHQQPPAWGRPQAQATGHRRTSQPQPASSSQPEPSSAGREPTASQPQPTTASPAQPRDPSYLTHPGLEPAHTLLQRARARTAAPLRLNRVPGQSGRMHSFQIRNRSPRPPPFSDSAAGASHSQTAYFQPQSTLGFLPFLRLGVGRLGIRGIRVSWPRSLFLFLAIDKPSSITCHSSIHPRLPLPSVFGGAWSTAGLHPVSPEPRLCAKATRGRTRAVGKQGAIIS